MAEKKALTPKNLFLAGIVLHFALGLVRDPTFKQATVPLTRDESLKAALYYGVRALSGLLVWVSALWALAAWIRSKISQRKNASTE